MPICVKCGKPCADCGAEAVVGGPAKACDLKKGAVWIHVMDDRGTGVDGVEVKLAGKTKKTKGGGFAAFDPMDAGDHTAELVTPLAEPIAKGHDAPKVSDASKGAPVSNGEITYVPFTLTRRAVLKVKVVQKDKPEKVFAEATVTVKGVENPPDTPTGGDGIADFKLVSHGKYTVQAALKKEDAEGFFTPEDALEVTLAPGDNEPVEIKAEPINVVTPKIEAEYLVVLRDRELAKHQESSEKAVAVDPTYIQVSFDQTNDAYPPRNGAELTYAADKVDVFVDDEECKPTSKLTGDLTKEQLAPGKKLKLYLKGKDAGTFDLKLKLKDPGDKRIKLDNNPAELKMGVVELELKVHRNDATALAAIQIDPDTHPIATYHTALKDEVLPAQEEMTDEDKVKVGRLLHVQKNGSHGRARLLCKKLEGAQWPAGTDDYKVVLTATSTSGKVKLHNKEWGDDDAGKVEIKVSDLKAAEKELWAEGETATDDLRHVRLALGIDRAKGGLDHKPKQNGDWARFTVVEIKEVKYDFSSDLNKAEIWDSGKKRFYINTDVDPDGRQLKSKPGKGKKIKITAELTKKLKDVKIHFMLSPNKDNHEKAHWGADLPVSFKFKKLDRALKAKDKADPKDLLHLSAKTDTDGVAAMEDLVLSRFGGDKFKIGAYIDEDPHLAKYVDGHADLSVKEPALTDEFQIWRRIWAQITRNQATAINGRGASVTAYEEVFVEYKEALDHTFDAGALGLPDHEAWQFKPGAGTARVLCMGDHNKATFKAMFVAATDEHSPKAHLVMCDAQWDPKAGPKLKYKSGTLVSTRDYESSSGASFGVFDPPLQGATIVRSGKWKWNDGVDVHEGPLVDANVAVLQARASPSEIQVTIPGTCPATCPCGAPGTAIAPTALKKASIELRLNAATGPWFGESGEPGDPQCLIVINPDDAFFNNTIIHEIGHLLNQVRSATGWHGLPDHPDYYDDRGGQGPHCKKDAVEDPGEQDDNGNNVYTGGTCAMFHLNDSVAFCHNCGADLRVRDLSDFFK